MPTGHDGHPAVPLLRRAGRGRRDAVRAVDGEDAGRTDGACVGTGAGGVPASPDGVYAPHVAFRGE